MEEVVCLSFADPVVSVLDLNVKDEGNRLCSVEGSIKLYVRTDLEYKFTVGGFLSDPWKLRLLIDRKGTRYAAVS
jgi:hypothetical protein